MTFDEWWGSDRDRTLAYNLMKVLSEAAKQAWHAGHATSIEEMLEKWNRTGVDIDAALHGWVNEKSPIANRLRMIAAAQPKWQPIESAPKDGTEVLLCSRRGRIASGCWSGADRKNKTGFWTWPYIDQEPTHWMPTPPAGAAQ